MASERFGCHDISRHRWGASARRESSCFSLSEGVPRSLWWLLASSGCTARGWDATGRGSGALRVGGAFVQYAQPLASRSRPSWSRPTRGDTQSGAGVQPSMTTGTLRRWRAGSGGGEPVTETPGRAARTPGSLLRGPVSTALTSTSLPSKHPAGIVEILRFFLVVRRRCACDVSTMDTAPLSRPIPSAPPSPPGPPACPGFPPERVSQK